MPAASHFLRRWLVRLRGMKPWRAPDGTQWVVDVVLPGSSNAMVMFYHPGGKTARLDRYNWYISNGPEARSVTSRLSEKKLLDSLSEDTLAQLFRRSMKVSRPDPLLPKQASN